MWGCSFPVMKTLNFEIDEHFSRPGFEVSTWLRFASAAWMLTLRFGLAFVLFAIVFRSTMRMVRRRHVIAGAMIGAVFFVGMMFQISGLATIPASRSGFLTSLVVIFTPLAQALIQRRPPRLMVIVGAIVALAGVSILTGLIEVREGSVGFADDALSRWMPGDTLTTIAAMVFAGQIMMVDSLGKRYESVAFTPSMFAMTALLALITLVVIFPLVPETFAAEPDTGITVWWTLTCQPRFFGLLAALSVFASLLAFAWMNKYQPVISAGEAAVVYTLEPVFASAWAMVLPGILSSLSSIAYVNETLNPTLLLGGGLIMIANALVLWPQRQ